MTALCSSGHRTQKEDLEAEDREKVIRNMEWFQVERQYVDDNT